MSLPFPEEIVIVFALSFIHMLCVSFQVRNTSQSRFGAYFFTSLVISYAWGFGLTYLIASSFDILLLTFYALGNSTGGMVGIYIHKRFMKKKGIEQW